MASVIAAMGHPPVVASVPRRNGDIHPNLWTDGFIQSLSSPYSASSYHERREALRKDIKDMLNELGKGEANPTADNLLERFSKVDVVQCLGVGRHFQKETKLVLDYSYRCWNEEGITLDLNATALGFRILRLNGYRVTTDVFNIFKDEDGQFHCAGTTKEEQYELRSMLSLHRASELVFPGETIMKEANIFTSKYLQRALKEWKESKLHKNQLIAEVDYALKYPWRSNAPRWEARNSIEIYRQYNTVSMLEKGDCNQKLLEMAILDFNILQCQHQSELKDVSRWWKDSSVSQLDFFRHRHVEFHMWYTSGLFEEEFSASRIGFSKLASMCTLLDDIYDTHGTLEELKPFTSALMSRDISAIDNLPSYMKISYKFVLETVEKIEKEIEKKQGHNPDVKKYAQDCMEKYILSYYKEAEWIASNYVPTLDEYLKNGEHSVGIHFLTMYTLLLMDNILSDKIFKELDFPSSKFQTLSPIIMRLVDDCTDFQEEEVRGESVSSVCCFKMENKGSTNEDALNYLSKLSSCYMEDLTREFLESCHFPACYKNIHFNAAVRGIYFMFNKGDGIYYADKEVKNATNNILIQSIPLVL